MDNLSQLVSLLKLDDGPRARPVQHFDFLALPGEVRNLIYRLTLTTDPPRLERQHRYSCDWCTWDPDEPQNKMVGRNGQTMPGCDRCWARRGPSLLLANRQIYDEAATIFWAENQFSFCGVDSFIRLVGSELRPQLRRSLTHVTIYRDPVSRVFSPRPGWPTEIPPGRFWDVLFQCKGLRALEMLPFFKEPHDFRDPTTDEFRRFQAAFHSWNRLRSALPNLKTLSWSYFHSYVAMAPYGRDPCMIEYPARITKHLYPEAFSAEHFMKYAVFLPLQDNAFGWNLCKTALPSGPHQCTCGRREHVCVGRPEGLRRAAAIIAGTETTTPAAAQPGEAPAATWKVDYVLSAANREPSTGTRNTLDAAHPGAIPTAWTVEFPFLPLTREAIARNAILWVRDHCSYGAGGEVRAAEELYAHVWASFRRVDMSGLGRWG